MADYKTECCKTYHCTFIDGGGGLFVSVRVFLLDMKLDKKLLLSF
jgi:hypothetical protein